MTDSKGYSIKEITDALIKSCISSNPSYFKPYLLSEKVTCEPDKEDFYKYFECMLAVSREKSEGELTVKVTFPNKDNRNVRHFEFNDAVHLHSRLVVKIEESIDSIYIDVIPF